MSDDILLITPENGPILTLTELALLTGHDPNTFYRHYLRCYRGSGLPLHDFITHRELSDAGQNLHRLAVTTGAHNVCEAFEPLRHNPTRNWTEHPHGKP